MDTSKLYEGMIVKNYKALCALLCEKVKTGNAKQYQIIDWSRYFEYEKEGNKIIIKNVFQEPKEKTVKRGSNNIKLKNLYVHMKELCACIIDDYGHDITSLTATSNTILKWLCPKCNKEHDREILRVYTNKHACCTACSTSKGEGTSLILLDELKIKYKKELTFPNLLGSKGSRLRFDFAIYNHDKLVGIIEYDGEYHDTDDATQEHDNIKNEYCKANNIPLYRIHHSEKKHLKERVINILLEMDIPITQKVNCCEKMKEIQNNKNNELLKEIERLQGLISSNNKVIDKYDGIKQTLNN